MSEEKVPTHPREDAEDAGEQVDQEEAKKAPPKKRNRPGVCRSRFWQELIHKNLKTIQREHIRHGRLDPHAIFRSSKERSEFYSDHSVSLNCLVDNHNFARWAIEEALREYPPDSHFKVTGQIMQGQFVTMETGTRTIPKGIAEAIRADGQQEVDLENPNDSKEEEAEIVQDIGTMVDAIISASPNSLGPPIEACVSYLQMKKCGTYGRNGLPMYKSPLWSRLNGEQGRKGFLPNQVTAIVWIMSRFLGKLPRLIIKRQNLWDPEKSEYVKTPETEQERMHRSKLRGPQYAGAILADSMGLGKTMATIACLDILAKQRLNSQRENEKEKHRPMLILTPNAIVAAQWVDEIEQIASRRGVKRIIISGNGAQKKSHHQRVRCLTTTEFENWPKKLNYIWDENDRLASRVVFVLSIDTWSNRTCKSTEANEETGEEMKYYSTFTEKGRKFSVVVVDEAYKIRHASTRNWKSVALLDRYFTLLITATPCMNLLSDLLGPVRLLWQGAEKVLEEKPKIREQIETDFGQYSNLQLLDNLEPWDSKQLVAGRPSLITKLVFKCGRTSTPVDIQLTRNFLKYFESLAILRRSSGSHLFDDWERTKPVSLDGLLPNVDNFTINIEPDHALAKAYQDAHIDLLIEYMKTVNKWDISKGGIPKRDMSKLIPVFSIHRLFQIAAASVDVYRLEQLFSLNGFSTKVEQIREMRKANVDFLCLAPFLLEPEDPKPKVALDYVKLAVRKSPILRYILHYVKENVLHKGPNGKIKKLLIVESSPILAYYYELVLQFLLIHCRTLHAKLTQEERRDLIASFNDDKDHSCQVLIQMYTVGFAGSNLHSNCSQVIVASQAVNFATQQQAVHRVIRVGQKSDVKVHRLKVNNSFHSFRESRQIEKFLPEQGTRAQGPTNGVLIQLLNLFQYEIDEAWKTPEAKELLASKNLLTDPITYQDDEEQEDNEKGDGEDHEPSPKRIKKEDEIIPKTEMSDKDLPEAMEELTENFEQASSQIPTQENEGEPEEEPEDSGESESSEEESDEESDEEFDTDSDIPTLGKRKREYEERPPPTSTADLFESSFREFLSLKSRAEYYKEFKDFPREVKSYFCHKKNNLRRMLSFGNLENNNATTRVWTAEDLDESAVLERAMELNLRVKLGASNLDMLPLPQIDLSLAPKKKVKRFAGLLAEIDVIEQEIEANCAKSPGKSSQSSSDMARTLKNVREDMTLAEIDQAYKDEITTKDIWSRRSGTAKKKKKKSHENKEGEEEEEEEEVDQQIASQISSQLEAACASTEQNQIRAGARDSDFATDNVDQDTRSRLKLERPDVKVKTEYSDTVTLRNVKEAPQTQSTDEESKVKQKGPESGETKYTSDDSIGPRIKKESPSRDIVDLIDLTHDGFTGDEMKHKSQVEDANDHSGDHTPSHKIKKESPVGGVIDLTDDNEDRVITNAHEPILIDDSDDDNNGERC
ncbi:SNF2 family N-terminal domain-containing protein [Hypoxylon sp. FL0543]|nr:SNF2 family N-terminal domain-containing protein [Hypoxylon sp. FL0543]